MKRHTVFNSCYLLSAICYLLPLTAEAAQSKGADKELALASANQGGGNVSSSKYQHTMTVGEVVAGIKLSSQKFKVLPGFLNATTTPSMVAPSELDILVLYAKADALGAVIPPATWQPDNDPIFIWEPPGSPSVAGYSYQIDGTADDTIDTSATSVDLASLPSVLTDGTHTFSVKAFNNAGSHGEPITIELWVDATPPQVPSYAPAPASLLSVAAPPVTATVSDGGSGVDPAALQVLVNGGAATVTWNASTNLLTAAGGAWQDGVNNIELRVADLIGNAPAPIIWSVTRDTAPPTGTLTINGGALLTTSLYVTLELSAADATTSVTRMLIGNDPLSGFVEELYATRREQWRLNPLRGTQTVYVKFIDTAGNISPAVSDAIELLLLSPETTITSGPAGFTMNRAATFTFMCPQENCVFSYAFDNEPWSAWSSQATAAKAEVPYGNHYFRVKAAKEVNGILEIQPDEEDPSPAERTWVVGVESPAFTMPNESPIKVWRVE
ncbi:MAG: hypothetical protein HY737_08085 [Candidatus Omnitrophica bacterium]|nr:hypothetical protein [Candidatus Omnitrophota bacterium]